MYSLSDAEPQRRRGEKCKREFGHCPASILRLCVEVSGLMQSFIGLAFFRSLLLDLPHDLL